jgi:hypothetical protein
VKVLRTPDDRFERLVGYPFEPPNVTVNYLEKHAYEMPERELPPFQKDEE